MSAVVVSANDRRDLTRLKFRFDAITPHVHVCSSGSSAESSTPQLSFAHGNRLGTFITALNALD